MNKNENGLERAQGKRLPVKGEPKNITELTAIARIREGPYPEKRLIQDYKDFYFGVMKQVISQIIPKKFLTADREIHVRAYANDLVGAFFNNKNPTAPPLTAQRTGEFLAKLRVSLKLRPIVTGALAAVERKLLQEKREMSWLEHLKWFGKWAHENRQAAIRKMVTIHYARWLIVDKDTLPGIDGPHLVFTSNFDGELEGYLEDFTGIDEGPLNAIFGHCIGWPGARPADGFIRYVKEHEFPALIFYANYPSATVGEVRRALDWKNKTQKFLENDLPKLQKIPAARKTLRKYLNDLAQPTPKEERDDPGI